MANLPMLALFWLMTPPIHHSRIFCTRWNGLDMTSGLGEALDDAELEGSVIGQLQDAVAFVRTSQPFAS